LTAFGLILFFSACQHSVVPAAVVERWRDHGKVEDSPACSCSHVKGLPISSLLQFFPHPSTHQTATNKVGIYCTSTIYLLRNDSEYLSTLSLTTAYSRFPRICPGPLPHVEPALPFDCRSRKRDDLLFVERIVLSLSFLVPLHIEYLPLYTSKSFPPSLYHVTNYSFTLYHTKHLTSLTMTGSLINGHATGDTFLFTSESVGEGHPDKIA